MSRVACVCVVLCLATLAVATLAPRREYSAYTFEDFETEYAKWYSSADERALRRDVFYQNLELIQTHNANPAKTYTMDVNKFADLTKEEMKRFYGRKKMAPSSPLRAAASHNVAPLKTLPTSVDWRTKGAVSPIKDQGGCGSCWAFAATETIESHLFLATGTMQILSPQNVLECTPNPNHCGGTGGCEGAIAELAFDWAEGGIALDSTVPYMGMDAACNASVPKAAKTGGHIKLAENDPNALMTALANIGPIAVSVDASSWSFYSGGIYNGCNAASPDVDHAVQAVGYGVDSSSGQGYWIVRNSWGTSWGESGFIRLYRGPNETCGMDNTPGDGSACAGQTQPVKVCGTCGIWYDNSYPINVTPF